MAKKDPLADDLNQKIKIPKINSGLSRANSGGRIKTNWGDINWTRKKLFFAALILGLPYVVAVIASLVAGIYLIVAILIGLGILVAFLFQVTRWLERDDNF